MQNQELDEAMAQCQRAATLTPDNEGIRQLQEKISMAQRASTS